MSTLTHNRKPTFVQDLLLSIGICIGLFLLSSVGMIFTMQLITTIPGKFTMPTLALYLLILLVAAYYGWRFISLRFSKPADPDEIEN